LALIEHSYVARVHDAGLTTSGRPYFVMEYVRGIPLTEHCDKHKLTVEERLGLFLQICEAVQHAHQKGVIHRDLKPSNILVTIEDNEAVPKVIDFGVARSVSQPLTERTFYTEQGQLIGTPEYMSPEQADRGNQDVDTRTDIYSLGVVLYELLAGVLPFDPQTFREGGVDRIRKVVCEEDPKTPSTRLGETSVEDSTESARRRRTNAKALQRRLYGDLDWITLKAMEKDRTRRYDSVGELAADVRRHLNHEPVLAGPPGTVYKIRKFVRRNRAMVAGVVVVLAVLIAGIVVSTLFAVGQARARAEAQAVSDLLQNSVIESLSLWTAKGRDVTIRSVLDATSQSLEGKFADKPLVEASIRRALGEAYTFLGVYEPAERHFKRVFEIRRAELGTEHQDTVISMWHLAWVYWWQGRYNEAEPLLTEALPGLERVLPEEHIDRLYCTAVLAWLYNGQGRLSEAEQLFAKGRDTVRRVLGDEHEYSPTFMLGLACSYRMQSRYEEAERLFNKALELSRRVRGEQDFETLGLMNNLGELYRDQGRYDEAEQLLLKALDGKRNFLGEQHSLTLETMISLAWLYHSQGRYEQAESLFVKTMETAGAVLGDEHYCSLLSMGGLGAVYVSQGRFDLAEPLLDKMLDIGDRVLGEKSLFTLSAMNTKAKLYRAQRRFIDAEKLFLKTLEIQRRLLGNDHPNTLDSINGFAVLRANQKEYDESERLLNEALEGRQNKLGDDHPDTMETMNDLSVLYKAQARYEEAEKLLLEAIEGRRLKLGDTHPHTLESWNNLIDLYEAWNKLEKAEEWRAKLPQTEAVNE
jgi:tetratricopeptide (TPR) repeat protein